MSVSPIAPTGGTPWGRITLAFFLQIHLSCMLLLDISRTFQPDFFTASLPGKVIWKC